ncbi:MAG: xanthine dehydrogenase small subunit [Acidimicrobiaceae bacterium]|jgi:aerobic-type carbon monoxide dehydrogenase small subunit (CoxS/CutS family)/CO/xanthine dehydrogenase Mo-binding subunit
MAVDSQVSFTVDGHEVSVDDDGASLLEVLRDRIGVRGAKDGCSPQGQCGCCTVLVDGAPRVACVTPIKRVAGRAITTIDGLERAEQWGQAFCANGASQCGFCTPGIIVRLDALRGDGHSVHDDEKVERALLAHLCRCTGWRTVLDAYRSFEHTDTTGRDLDAASLRAEIEGGVPQRVGPEVSLGRGRFADDIAPLEALVAVPDGHGGWAVAETLTQARRAASKTQGRRTTVELAHPLDVPPGEWAVALRTAWVEPAYLETDASWCRPGGEPASPLANGGAFGGKVSSVVMAAARELADRHGRAVRVLLSREDTVRLGAKRPPIAAGLQRDGTGIVRVVRTPGIADAITTYAPGLHVEEVDVAGLPTSVALRAAGWAEAAVLLAGARGQHRPVTAPNGAVAEVHVDEGDVRVRVCAGDPLDEVVLRSYCIGAAHMALGWVSSEGIAVDDTGEPLDLTIRSFGVLRAVDTPPITVEIDDDGSAPRNGSDAVFAAVAAATWVAQGCPPTFPTGRTLR